MADPARPSTDAAPAEHWRYTIEHEDGRLLRGEVVGRTEAEARRKLRALGGTPLEMTRATPGSGLFSARRTHLTRSETLDLARGLAELVGAGIPLRDALAGLAEQEGRPVMRAVLARLEDKVRHGEAFSRALETDPAGLPRMLIALVKAGEASGLLGQNLIDLAGQMEDEHKLRQDITGQLIYPLMLVCMISLTLVFLAFFVLPQFDEIFLNAAVTPPAVTRFVLGAGAFIRAYVVWIPPLAIGLVVFAQLLARQFATALDALLIAMPFFGSTLKSLDAVRYCRTLGLLLASGQPLSKADAVARGSVGSASLRQRYAIAAEAVREGQALSVALARQHVLPPQALRFIELGEKTGKLDAMLTRAAVLHDREIRLMLKSVVEFIGPAMIALLGLCVGGVIAGVMVGVLSLNEVVF